MIDTVWPLSASTVIITPPSYRISPEDFHSDRFPLTGLRFFRTYVGLYTGNFAVKCLTYLPTYLPSAASGRRTYLPTYLLSAASGRRTYLPTYLPTLPAYLVMYRITFCLG